MKRLVLLLLFVACGLSAEARRVGVFCFFVDDGKQVYDDENVRVVIAVDNGRLCLAVLNKTDRVIYLDKGSSFVYENGVATCLFSNSSYSSGTGRSGGGSVNLGGIAGALGIGGRVGGILGGVNVGGGQTTQNSTTIYEQRIMAMAPKAYYKLYSWSFSYKCYVADPKPRKKGRTWSYGRHDTPYAVDASLRYSFDENFASAEEVAVSDYISDMVYDKVSYAKHNYLYDGTYCRQFTGRNGLCYVDGTANGLWIFCGAMGCGLVVSFFGAANAF